MKTYLVLQSFGKKNEYNRAILTVLSYYAHTSLPVDQTKIILFTDNPRYFDPYLHGLPITFVLLTPEKIKRMRGEIDFLHRIKIAVIEEAFSISDGVMLYADSDTFFVADPAALSWLVSPDTAFMHLLEYPFEEEVEDKTETYRNFYKLIKQNSFTLSNGKQIEIDSSHCSWNAGVMFLHPTHAGLIPDVYALTNQFYLGSGSHASEQYAFSVVMQENAELSACDSVIYHYWYRVKKQIVDQLLLEVITKNWGVLALSKKIADIKKLTEILPSYFEEHLLMKQDYAIQAFNSDRMIEGYKWTFRSIVKDPMKNGRLMKDAFYHTLRCMKLR